jgi:phospholipid/cholesterol/gamma-HCH transport system ATP-binding protein
VQRRGEGLGRAPGEDFADRAHGDGVIVPFGDGEQALDRLEGVESTGVPGEALALDPELLFLDEPTAGLDPVTAGHFDKLLRELAQAMNLTVFLVTHDLDTLAAICDRICVLYAGKVAAIGTLDEVRQGATGWINDYFSGPRGRAALGPMER